jgi:DNA topoisomerase-1
MEQSLDDISNGQADRLPYLKQFYSGRAGLAEQVQEKEEQIDPRAACTLNFEGLQPAVRVGKFGPYLELPRNNDDRPLTASLPEDIAPADLNSELAEQLIARQQQGSEALGMHPDEGLPIYVRTGRFGPFVQLGDKTEEGPKPRYSSIPNNIDPGHVSVETAIKLLELPRTIGLHPDDQKVVKAGIGRFGPYVLHDKKYGNFDRKTHTFTTSDGRVLDILTVDMPAALEMLARSKSRGETPPLKVLGEHPEDGQPVAIYEGRYGPYVRHGKKGKQLASIPKDREIDSVTLQEAIAWINEKVARKGGGRRAAKPTAARKTPHNRPMADRKARPPKKSKKSKKR